MHAEPQPKRPTYADIEALPPGVRGEIIAGELVALPRPAPPHVQAATALAGLLFPAFQLGRGGPGGWWIHLEPELSLGLDPDYDLVVPDLAGWRLETMPRLPDTAQYPVVPDWVCEVLSPRTASTDRIRKLPFYARAGVGHAWLVDPLARTLEVFRLTDGRWQIQLLAGGDDEVAAEPFDAVKLSLSDLWVPTGG